MDAIEFYHTDECSTDIYEAMEQYKKHGNRTPSSESKEQFLINLAKEHYNQGDNYYAMMNKKDVWHFGYSNDKPLQHGKGASFSLSDAIVDVLYKNSLTDFPTFDSTTID